MIHNRIFDLNAETVEINSASDNYDGSNWTSFSHPDLAVPLYANSVLVVPNLTAFATIAPKRPAGLLDVDAWRRRGGDRAAPIDAAAVHLAVLAAWYGGGLVTFAPLAYRRPKARWPSPRQPNQSAFVQAGGGDMMTFIVFLNWTEQGREAFKERQKRYRTAKSLVENWVTASSVHNGRGCAAM